VTILDPVRQAYAAGLGLLPVRADGSKAPDVESWTPFQTTRPTIEQMRAWDFAHRDGFGMVAGPVSGYRESWDFDCADTFEAFVAAATAAGLGDVVHRVRTGYEDLTPSGGRRWIVGYPPDVAWKDQPFARREKHPHERTHDKDRIKTLIESTMFAILAPSNGRTHPTGGTYRRVSGGFTSIASYTADERAALIQLARSFDQMPKRDATPRHATPAPSAGGTRPGDDYNARASWPDILPDWMLVHERSGVQYLRRPGKTIGVSATINALGTDRLHVFTSSSAFDPDTSYSKFGAYAVLEHGGDFARAALALSRQGYGDQGTTTTAAEPSTETGTASAPGGFSRPVVTEGLGDCVLQPRLAHAYNGWFMRGGVHLVAGSSGAGKTTLVLALLEQQARGGIYLGHVGSRLDFLVIFADRGKVSNDETLERMRITPGSLTMAHIPPVANGQQAVTAILHAIETQDDLPAVVFLEGADMLVEDASKTQVVSPFMGALRRIAEHYSLAMILSVGAPKAKPHEQYTLKRDQVFGSQAWARLANDVLVMSITGDGSVPTRDLVVLHRNAAAEKFSLSFEGGRLVEAEPQPASEADMVTWFAEVERFTARQFRRAFPKLSGARAAEILDGYVALKVLRTRVEQDRTRYIFRRPHPRKPNHSAPQEWDKSHSGRDDSREADEVAETVLKKGGMGHGNGSAGSQFPKDCASSSAPPLVSVKNGFLSQWDGKSTPDWDKNPCPTIPSRAREAGGVDDDLPAWVTEDAEPDFSDPIGAHDKADE